MNTAQAKERLIDAMQENERLRTQLAQVTRERDTARGWIGNAYGWLANLIPSLARNGKSWCAERKKAGDMPGQECDRCCLDYKCEAVPFAKDQILHDLLHSDEAIAAYERWKEGQDGKEA